MPIPFGRDRCIDCEDLDFTKQMISFIPKPILSISKEDWLKEIGGYAVDNTPVQVGMTELSSHAAHGKWKGHLLPGGIFLVSESTWIGNIDSLSLDRVYEETIAKDCEWYYVHAYGSNEAYIITGPLTIVEKGTELSQEGQKVPLPKYDSTALTHLVHFVGRD